MREGEGEHQIRVRFAVVFRRSRPKFEKLSHRVIRVARVAAVFVKGVEKFLNRARTVFPAREKPSQKIGADAVRLRSRGRRRKAEEPLEIFRSRHVDEAADFRRALQIAQPAERRGVEVAFAGERGGRRRVFYFLAERRGERGKIPSLRQKFDGRVERARRRRHVRAVAEKRGNVRVGIRGSGLRFRLRLLRSGLRRFRRGGGNLRRGNCLRRFLRDRRGSGRFLRNVFRRCFRRGARRRRRFRIFRRSFFADNFRRGNRFERFRTRAEKRGQDRSRADDGGDEKKRRARRIAAFRFFSRWKSFPHGN